MASHWAHELEVHARAQGWIAAGKRQPFEQGARRAPIVENAHVAKQALMLWELSEWGRLLIWAKAVGNGDETRIGEALPHVSLGQRAGDHHPGSTRKDLASTGGFQGCHQPAPGDPQAAVGPGIPQVDDQRLLEQPAQYFADDQVTHMWGANPNQLHVTGPGVAQSSQNGWG